MGIHGLGVDVKRFNQVAVIESIISSLSWLFQITYELKEWLKDIRNRMATSSVQHTLDRNRRDSLGGQSSLEIPMNIQCEYPFKHSTSNIY